MKQQLDIELVDLIFNWVRKNAQTNGNGHMELTGDTDLRKQLKKEEAFQLFATTLAPERLSVEESYETYYDTLEGHWGWWVRIEGQFIGIPVDKRERCNREVRDALQSLAGEKGIPYTIHRLRVMLHRV